MGDHAKESASTRVPPRVLLKIIVVRRVIKRLGWVWFKKTKKGGCLSVPLQVLLSFKPTNYYCLRFGLPFGLGGWLEQLGASGSGKTSITKVRGS